MRTKLFYHAPWQAGYEIDDEYRDWLEGIEKDSNIRGFQRIANSKKGNWLRVVYDYSTFIVE